MLAVSQNIYCRTLIMQLANPLPFLLVDVQTLAHFMGRSLDAAEEIVIGTLGPLLYEFE